MILRNLFSARVRRVLRMRRPGDEDKSYRKGRGPVLSRGPGWRRKDAQPSRPIGSLTHWLDVSSEGGVLTRQGARKSRSGDSETRANRANRNKGTTPEKKKKRGQREKRKPQSEVDQFPWMCGNKERRGGRKQKKKKKTHKQFKKHRSIQIEARPGCRPKCSKNR